MDSTRPASFSHIVVGGGSSGCVLASRLSERAANRVLLIEAGSDTPPGAVPDDIADSYAGRAAMNPAYFWPQLRAELAARSDNRGPHLARYEQARVMGGGSSVNGQVITRGGPGDYDLWEALGAEGWGWRDVLPCFRRIERDLDFAGPEHGNAGPIPVRRIPRARWDAFSEAVGCSLEAQGFCFLPDLNASFAEGFGPVPVNTALDGCRVSSAIGYLDATVRSRPNLVIRDRLQVRRILFDGRRAIGVEADQVGGGREAIHAGEVILCAGAILSPTLLMRSGIGPAAHLAGLGTGVVADVPGVGRNLQEHAAVHVSAFLRRAARGDGGSGRHNHLYLRYASGVEGARPPDMLLNFAFRSGWHAVGRRLATMQAYILQPFSRGTVRLAGPEPERPPEIRFQHLDDPRDLERLTDAVRRAAALFRAGQVAALTDAPFATCYSDRVREAGRVTLRNRLAMAVLGSLLDAGGAVRRGAIHAFINEAPPLEALLADEDLLRAHVRRSVSGVWHAAGTCRMGVPMDPMAVTDPQGRVRGVAGLRVADNSLMPEIPRCNTNFPAMMIGERVAELMLAGA